MQTCVPPQSLATWSALLLYGAIALGAEALGLLFTLRPMRGGRWSGLALRGVLLSGALAIAAWSLAIRASAQAIYEYYVTLFEGDDYHPPNSVACAMDFTGSVLQRHMQEVAAPIEQSAAIASGASAALLIVGAYLLARWIWQRWRVTPQSIAGGAESDEWQREGIV